MFCSSPGYTLLLPLWPGTQPAFTWVSIGTGWWMDSRASEPEAAESGYDMGNGEATERCLWTASTCT